MKKLMFAMGIAAMLGLGGAVPGVSMAQTESKCPVMGLKTDDKIYTQHQGKRINFCCNDCIEKFKSDPDKYMNKGGAEAAKPVTKPAK